MKWVQRAWSLRREPSLKFLLHVPHLKNLQICFLISPGSLNIFWHFSHVYLLPSWKLVICIFKFPLLAKVFSHLSHSTLLLLESAISRSPFSRASFESFASWSASVSWTTISVFKGGISMSMISSALFCPSI